MKLIIQKLWMVMAMLCLSISATAYDFEADGIYYNITSMSDLEVEVTYKSVTYVSGNSYRNDSYTGDIVIPSTVNYNNRTFTVTGIGRYAFGSGGAESYGSYYDNYGCKITSISLPSSIKIIKELAFQNCRKLSDIELPISLKTIGIKAFSNSTIGYIIIPDAVEAVEDDAFTGCPNLQYVVLVESVKSFGERVFGGSKLLEVFCRSKECPPTLTKSIFYGHSALEIYVPSKEVYGFGREYLTFPISTFEYTGQSHNIQWTNNLKAYKCQIVESECKSEADAGKYTKYLTATYSNGIDFSVEIPYSYTINKAPMTLRVNWKTQA